MALFDVDELVENSSRVFINRDADDVIERESGPSTLNFWDDDERDENEPFWALGRDADRNYLDELTTTPEERKLAEKTFAQQTPGSSAAFQAAQAATGMTLGDFTLKMLAREGMEYEWGGTSAKTGFDCSGIINRIMTNAGYENYPRHSSAIYEHSKKIPLEKAIKTRGAILYTEGHIAISLGNGKTIEAMGEDYGVVKGNAHGRFKYGGLLPELLPGKAQVSRQKKGRKPAPLKRGKPMVQAVNPVDYDDPFASFSTAMPLLVNDVVEEVQGLRKRGTKPATDLSSVERQMRRGFLEAGRPDLARMVGTTDFYMWVNQESGWKRNITSAANNQGLPNDGFFQVWRGHDYNANGEVRKMTAREQAYLVATKFDLTADDIKRYARQIRDGSYEGWG